VNAFEQAASSLASASAQASSPALKAALNDARAAFDTATGIARTGSPQQIIAMFESGLVDDPLIRVFTICNA
jgi:hypothetical protein